MSAPPGPSPDQLVALAWQTVDDFCRILATAPADNPLTVVLSRLLDDFIAELHVLGVERPRKE